MPAPQLHLTFGDHLARLPGLADEMARACAAEPRYTRFGSIFHDLPYYGNMPLMAIRYGLRRPAEESYWGTKLHYDRTDAFLETFVRTARSIEAPLSRGERLAIVCGFASHVALDLSLHPLVNFIARRDQAIEGGAESHHHRLAEKYHSMFFHLDRDGRDIIGSREMLERTRVTKASSLVRTVAERSIIDFTRSAYTSMWQDAPSAGQVHGWIRSFAQFGVMVGGRMALRNSLRLRTPENRTRYFACGDFDFYEFWKVGEARGVEIANRCFTYFDRADFDEQARARFIADVAFDGTLAEPLNRRGPALPSALPLERAA